jgi:hypothetical protein
MAAVVAGTGMLAPGGSGADMAEALDWAARNAIPNAHAYATTRVRMFMLCNVKISTQATGSRSGYDAYVAQR